MGPGFFFAIFPLKRRGLEEATTKFRVDGFGVGFRGLLFRLLLTLLGLFLGTRFPPGLQHLLLQKLRVWGGDFPIFRLIFFQFFGEAETKYLSYVFPISGRRRGNPALAGGQGRKRSRPALVNDPTQPQKVNPRGMSLCKRRRIEPRSVHQHKEHYMGAKKST